MSPERVQARSRYLQKDTDSLPTGLDHKSKNRRIRWWWQLCQHCAQFASRFQLAKVVARNSGRAKRIFTGRFDGSRWDSRAMTVQQARLWTGRSDDRGFVIRGGKKISFCDSVSKWGTPRLPCIWYKDQVVLMQNGRNVNSNHSPPSRAEDKKRLQVKLQSVVWHPWPSA